MCQYSQVIFGDGETGQNFYFANSEEENPRNSLPIMSEF